MAQYRQRGSNMRNLGKYVKKYGILYVVAIAAMVVSILLDAASPQITRHIIDDVIVGGKMEMLMRLLLGLLGIGLGRAIFQYMKEFIFDYSASGKSMVSTVAPLSSPLERYGNTDSMLWASDYSQSAAPQKLWPTVPQA